MRIFNIFLILFVGVNAVGQDCFNQLFDATGLNISSTEIQELDDISCDLKNTFPPEFQSQFKVFDLGFYSLNEYMNDGFGTVWTNGIAEAGQQSNYYILFGRQLQASDGVTKIWFSMNLPTTGSLSCIQPDQINVLENLINEILSETNNPFEFANKEVEALDKLIEWITIFKNCCETSCEEICDNGIDDDFDGLVDCDDIDCLYEQIGLKDDSATKKSVTSCYILNAAEESCIAAHGEFYESLALDSDEAMFLCRAVPAYTFPELPNLPDFDLLDWLIDQIKETGNELARRILIKTVESIAAYAQSEVEAYLENLIQNGTPFQISIGLFIEFATGLGPQSRHFDEDHTLTISLKESNYTCLALNAWFNGYLEVLDPQNPRTEYPEGYRVDFPNIVRKDIVIFGDSIVNIPWVDLNETGPIRELIADGGYTTAQFIGTGYFDFDYDPSTMVLDLELYDTKTLYSLLLHLVDDRHPREVSPFFGETEQTYSFSMTLSEIETRILDCSTEICDEEGDEDGDGFEGCDDLDCYSDIIEGQNFNQKQYKNSDGCPVLTPEEIICLNEYAELVAEFNLHGRQEAQDLCAKINDILSQIQTDPYVFFTNCFDKDDPNSYWKDLAAFRVPASVVTVVESRGSDDWFVQEFNDAAGAVVNADFYSVNLGTTLAFDGVDVTPQQMFDSIRINFLNFDDGCNTTFGLNTGASNENDQTLWLSNNPVGAIVDIDITPLWIFNLLPDDDATVVTSAYNNDSATNNYNWTFSTISTPFFENGDHPVSGHRQFGLVQEPTTMNWIFYTRGLDRVSKNYLSLGLIDQSGPVLGGGHDLWTCLTQNLANELNGTVVPHIVHRPDWDKVKDEILDLTPSEVIDCKTFNGP